MSGVAKDDTNSTSATDETAPAVGKAEAGHAESPVNETAAESETRAARRAAPHLRVVTDSDAVFAASDPALSPAAIEHPHQRIGAIFRATRENLGFSLEQVSKETRVHLSHLRAIEDMTPNLLGAPVYAKGYIRTYARHLGLDETSTLDRYLRECAILKDPEKQSIAPPVTGRNLPVAVPVLGFLVVALVGAAGAFFFMNGSEKPAVLATVAAAPDAAAPSVADPQSAVVAVPATDVAPAAQQLRVVAVKRALIEVRSAAGDKYVRRYFEPGESYPVRVGYGWTVSSEDGSAFEWRLGDQSLGLLQAEGGPVYSQSVDIAAKRPPVEAPPLIEDPSIIAEAAPVDASSAPAVTSTAPPASSATAPKPRVPKPQPKPQTETQPPAVAAAKPAQPATPPVTPAQDPALLAYPGQ
jgi:cytoskeleton protein RodZ